MNVSTILFLPFSRTAGWKELQQRDVSIPALVWLVVMPLSLLPPIMLYYAGTHYGDDFFPGFADRPWRHIATILFLAELLTFFVMGWLIHTVVNGQEMSISYHDAYLRETRVFLDVIAGRAENPSPPRDALVSLRLAEACEESLRVGKPVEVGA